MKYEFMKQHQAEFSVERMSKVFKVSRSGYYRYIHAQPSLREQENQRLIEQIKAVHDKLLLSLKTDYETLKSQADAAYKKPDIQEAKALYQAAAGKYEEISKIWEQLFQQEGNEILKSYYQEQQTYYIKGANQLRNLLIHKNYATHSNAKEENPSFEIRQRKAVRQKQQSIYEEQSSVNKLII